jgi:hypothetical protein
MLWELLAKGTLPPLEFAAFVACCLVLVAGPTAIWLIWITRPRDGGHDEKA